jgi:DNA-directed RNA polymerase specialized sigma24 family protein
MKEMKNGMFRRWTGNQARHQTCPAGNDGAPILQSPEAYSTLLRVVATVAPDRGLQEDLLQEAVIHLWQLSNQRPGQSPSWYFKSCQLYLLNLLRKGRSIDSLKHRKGRIRPEDQAPDDPNEGSIEGLLNNSNSEDPVFAQVSARDMLTSLCQWLDPPDCLILEYLADGLSAREIASRLQLSHTAVVKRQRKIASVAMSLGFVPSARKCARKISMRSLRAKPATGAGS